jgi:hypothetical protein
VARAAGPAGTTARDAPPRARREGRRINADGGAPGARAPARRRPRRGRSFPRAPRAIPIAPTEFPKGGSAAGVPAAPRDGGRPDAAACRSREEAVGHPARRPASAGGRGRAGTDPLGAAGDRWRAANGPRRPSVPGGRIPRAFSPPTADGWPGHAAPGGDGAGGDRRPAEGGSCHLGRSQRRGPPEGPRCNSAPRWAINQIRYNNKPRGGRGWRLGEVSSVGPTPSPYITPGHHWLPFSRAQGGGRKKSCAVCESPKSVT